MKNSPSNVLVVDDDVGIHRALAKLLELAGFAMHGFLSAEDFLTAEKPEGPGCLLLDMKMPGMNGLVLQRAMATSERKYPIIFLTGNGDVHSCADAMKMGAVDFFTKPCSPDELIDAIERALRLDIAASELRDNRRSIEQRVATLTRRETQVMQHVATGLLNKHLINADPALPAVTTVAERFCGLMEAYRRVGYVQLSHRERNTAAGRAKAAAARAIQRSGSDSSSRARNPLVSSTTQGGGHGKPEAADRSL